MNKGAIIIIILNNTKLLLSHPTNARWTKTYAFPKGGIEKGESKILAAIRELKEETSIEISEEKIIDKDPIRILYSDKKGKVYKKLYLFKVYINDISEIGLTSEVIPKDKLQAAELDWCGFLTKEEAIDKIFYRIEEGLLNLIN